MRFSILGTFERGLAQGVALVVLGGLGAGCSSGVSRFEESIFTGSADKDNRAVAAPASAQPYPGDAEYRTANLDNTHTGSVNRRVVRPDVPVGGGNAPDAGRAGNASPARTASEPVALAPRAEPADEARAGWNGAGGSEITVREGETVYNLSRRFGVPVDAILKANGMEEATNLQAGQTLAVPRYAYARNAPVSAPDSDPRVAEANTVPEPAAPADDSSQRDDRVAVLPQVPKPGERPEHASAGETATATTTAGGAYTVESGDTLYGIAKKTGVDIDRIRAANGLDNGYLQIGQKLTIPGAGAAQSTESRKTAESEDVDPIVTGGPDGDSQSAASRVSSYTPPDPSGKTVEEAGEEMQVAAVAPDSSGISRMRWPVRGRVVSGFGESGGSGRNDGIDIAVPEGTPVKAAENGVVIYAGDGLKDFGNTVLVRHEDGLVTVYGHAGSLKVKRGDEIRRGQELALSGMSGNADRPKLHFEVRKESAPVDPAKYLE